MPCDDESDDERGGSKPDAEIPSATGAVECEKEPEYPEDGERQSEERYREDVSSRPRHVLGA